MPLAYVDSVRFLLQNPLKETELRKKVWRGGDAPLLKDPLYESIAEELRNQTDEFRSLRILNYEMESGTLFKAGLVYGVAVGCVCAVVAQRTVGEQVQLETKDGAVDRAIDVAVATARTWLAR